MPNLERPRFLNPSSLSTCPGNYRKREGRTGRAACGRREPLMTIQYHSEASPGPLDNMYIFERFVEMLSSQKVVR